MPSKKSIISLALGSALAATLGTASIASAAESPFTVQSLNKSFMVAGSHDYGSKAGKSGDKKCGEGRCGMSMADTNNDGRVSRDEYAAHSQLMFDKMDTNKDGFIDKDEVKAMKKKEKKHDHSGKSSGKSASSGSSDIYGSDTDWTNPNLEHMKTMGE